MCTHTIYKFGREIIETSISAMMNFPEDEGNFAGFNPKTVRPEPTAACLFASDSAMLSAKGQAGLSKPKSILCYLATPRTWTTSKSSRVHVPNLLVRDGNRTKIVQRRDRYGRASATLLGIRRVLVRTLRRSCLGCRRRNECVALACAKRGRHGVPFLFKMEFCCPNPWSVLTSVHVDIPQGVAAYLTYYALAVFVALAGASELRDVVVCNAAIDAARGRGALSSNIVSLLRAVGFFRRWVFAPALSWVLFVRIIFRGGHPMTMFENAVGKLRTVVAFCIARSV
eukprot:SAG31_NODE_1963_length_6802_cov_2.758168_3_plen_284_part_00